MAVPTQKAEDNHNDVKGYKEADKAPTIIAIMNESLADF